MNVAACACAYARVFRAAPAVVRAHGTLAYLLSAVTRAALNGRLRRLGCAGGRAAHLGVHATPHPYAGRRAGGGTAGAEPRCESDAATALTLRRVAMSEGDAEAARIAWVKRAVCDGLNLEEALRRRVAQPERQFLVRVAPNSVLNSRPRGHVGL